MRRPVDLLSDDDLNEVNAAHAWESHTEDSRGRWVGRRDKPFYPIPHHLVESLNEWVDNLGGKDVVEFGCFEGAHTIALCNLAYQVCALEARADSLVKTAVRTALYGVFPRLLHIDVEKRDPPPADVYFHSGVLYHLQDPAIHLGRLGMGCGEILLDTHYTKSPTMSYQSADGRRFKVEERPEHVTEAKAGMRDLSRWLPLDTIKALLGDHFSDVAVLSDREERNGPRVTIFAKGGRRAR